MDDPNQIGERQRRGIKAITVDLWYPRIDGHITHIEVGLCDVRSADSIRISYDFERDGYKIEQASTFQSQDLTGLEGAELEAAKDYDEDWQEVAFVQAWAREKEVP